ncbi:U32 family peptidase [Clostridium felsineum]|uniref:U32 family peptidase n=1 Tax=Clostridium felsineum TaxID=36839 RepID=UPI00214D87CA|nr:U32 family peptidase [Clostridium felsineum]MCR3759892.1 U32 family peptidase [Clostridium felsineum]
MRYFVMPSDFKKKTIDDYCKLNEKYKNSKIIETYGQTTIGGGIFFNARKISEICNVDLVRLKDYIEYSKEMGIGFNYTLNATCNGNIEFTEKGISEMHRVLGQLYNAGVRALTVAMPSILEIVKESGYDFKIKTSTLCLINNANKAIKYKKKGVDRIVVDEDITRKFDVLKEICDAYGDGVEIIANDTCLKGCPYKMFHFNYTAHSYDDPIDAVKDYYVNRCIMQRTEQLKNYLNLNWIRPEDLKYYESIGIKYFKIQGRQFAKDGEPVKVAEAYMKESFDGNLFDLLNLFVKYNSFSAEIDNKKLEGFIKKFYDNPRFCRENCDVCNYCEVWARKSIDYSENEKINIQGREFLEESDRFKALINKVKEESGESKRKEIFEF